MPECIKRVWGPQPRCTGPTHYTCTPTRLLVLFWRESELGKPSTLRTIDESYILVEKIVQMCLGCCGGGLVECYCSHFGGGVLPAPQSCDLYEDVGKSRLGVGWVHSEMRSCQIRTVYVSNLYLPWGIIKFT